MNIKIKRLNNKAIIPKYATEGSIGLDLYACIPDKINIEIYPGESKLIPTGLSIELPNGYAALVIPRSGLSLKTPLRIANSPGLIDSDYRGEIGVICYNTKESVEIKDCIKGNLSSRRELSNESIIIKNGDRIAQLVILPIPRIEFEEVEELSATDRNNGGFGSTGE